MSTASAGIKMTLFTVVTLLATALLAVTIQNSTYQASTTYHAVFTDAVNLVKGDEVRVAGVRVGSISGARLYRGDEALVTFTVDKDVPLTGATTGVIRYRNLIGQRYLALVDQPSMSTSAAPLAAGATIAHTQPALDLNVLFHGFRPLLVGLDPTQVNQLSYELVKVLQGEGGTIDTLLTQVGSLSTTLADREQLVTSVIANLNAVLGPIDERDAQLTDLIGRLQSFLTGLSADRKAIGDSLVSIRDLTGTTADLLTQARAPLRSDIAQLGVLAEKLDTTQSRQLLQHFLDYTPFKLQSSTPETSYGAFLNFYVCAVNFILPNGTETPPRINDAQRCHL